MRGDAKSAEVKAARSLLRRLSDPQGIRWSPLLRQHFVDERVAADPRRVQRVRAIVQGVVESLKTPYRGHKPLHAIRQHAIITRYDLGREPRDVVQKDLGIQVSKFYYERRAALLRIASELASQPPLVSHYEMLPSRPSLREQCVEVLHAVGRGDLSIALVEDILQNTESNAERARLYCRLVFLYCEAGEIRSAINSLNAAKTSVDISPQSAENAVLAAELIHAELKVAWNTGKMSEAIDIGQQGRHSLHALLKAGDSQSRLVLAYFLKALGDIQTNAGLIDDAITSCNEGLEALGLHRQEPRAAIAVRAGILTTLAFAQAITVGNMPTARATNAKALELAMRNALLPEAMLAHVNESMFQYWRGSVRKALEHLRIAQPITAALCQPIEQSRVAILHARIEALCGHEHAALDRVRQARSVLPQNTYLWVLSQIVESQILVRVGANRAALRAAKTAAAFAERIGSERGFGMASMLLAEAFEWDGDVAKALEQVKLSISALEKSASLYPLSQALECAARLTGSRTHRADAAEIITSFQR